MRSKTKPVTKKSPAPICDNLSLFAEDELVELKNLVAPIRRPRKAVMADQKKPDSVVPVPAQSEPNHEPNHKPNHKPNHEPNHDPYAFPGLLVCGVDEAGRGPLAGAVYAAAVILDPGHPIAGLRDSKKLSEVKRDQLALLIKQHALAWCVACASVEEIDRINILQATMLAMKRAVEGLGQVPAMALIDGNRCPDLAMRAEAIVKGDDKVAAISAASILAKTARDANLLELHVQYPEYAFDQHKGYPTALHLERLREHGVSPVHRRSYGPVRALIS